MDVLYFLRVLFSNVWVCDVFVRVFDDFVMCGCFVLCGLCIVRFL